MRTKTHRGVGAEKFAQKKFQRAFQVGDADFFIHVKSFDLVELRAVRGIDFIATISRARRDDADRRRRGFHRANLHGGSVRAQQPAVGQIKCVLLVARGMIGRGVERVEAMPFRFDVGSVGERESHAAENRRWRDRAFA